MAKFSLIFCALLLLSACATQTSPKVEAEQKHRVYCITHAREVVGEADVESRYINCLHVKGRHEIVVDEDIE